MDELPHTHKIFDTIERAILDDWANLIAIKNVKYDAKFEL